MTANQPDILVSSDASLVAIRDQDGAYAVSDRRRNRFEAEIWARRNGQDFNVIERFPDSESGFPGQLNCGEYGCRYISEGVRIALSHHPSTHRRDCAWADILIAADPVKRSLCRTDQIIDLFAVWNNGAHAIDLKAGRIKTVAGSRGERPWMTEDYRE